MDGGTDVLVRSASRCVCRGVTGHSTTEQQSVTHIHRGACLSRIKNVKALVTYKPN
jgi:hypothetical protein